jgi:glycosyltransferase involved in cell wall biosynthesis
MLAMRQRGRGRWRRVFSHNMPLMQYPVRVLIVPEYDTFGGTLTFFLQLLQVHQENGIRSAVLIQPGQASSAMLSRFAQLGVRPDDIYVQTWGVVGARVQRIAQWLKRVDVRFGSKFEYPIYAVRSKLQQHVPQLYDWLFARQAVKHFCPDLIITINGDPGARLGVMLFAGPVLNVIHTYPTTRLRAGLVRLANWISRCQGKHFVTVSRFSAQRISQNLGVQPAAISVIYNSYRPPESPLPAPMMASSVLPTVLTIGHMNDYKDPETWFAVAQRVLTQLPQARFVWLGNGHLYDEMCQRIRATGLSERIITPGYISAPHQIDRYYAEASVYYQPSLIESQGIAVADAMVRGLPCVVSNIGGLPESVVHDETGYVCPARDVDAMSARISDLLQDRALAQHMGAAGRQRVQDTLSFAAQSRQYLALYQRLRSMYQR